MDVGLLSQAIETVKQDSISLYSLLVICNGYIVSETYSQGATGQPRKIFSCTKSFTSTLVGIAFDQGLIDGVNPSVLSFFPGRTFQNNDARKQAMTLENVLTMNTGLDWVEGDPSYQKLYTTQDWAGRCTTCPWQPNRASFSTIAPAALTCSRPSCKRNPVTRPPLHASTFSVHSAFKATSGIPITRTFPSAAGD
jgi:CubicO group peptidase (beta-lactamase class C family)